MATRLKNENKLTFLMSLCYLLRVVLHMVVVFLSYKDRANKSKKQRLFMLFDVSLWEVGTDDGIIGATSFVVD